MSYMITTDPTFLAVMDNEKDMTIQVLTWHFLHGTGCIDAIQPSLTMVELIRPKDPHLIVYRSTNPTPPSFMSNMIQGASSPEKLLSGMASLLVHFDGGDTPTLVDILSQVHDLACMQNLDIVRAFCKHQAI
ncbi:hypothetical protein BKA93DRAFT_826351 [Sparassis latifolia]